MKFLSLIHLPLHELSVLPEMAEVSFWNEKQLSPEISDLAPLRTPDIQQASEQGSTTYHSSTSSLKQAHYCEFKNSCEPVAEHEDVITDALIEKIFDYADGQQLARLTVYRLY